MAAATAANWMPSCAGIAEQQAVGDAVQALLREHPGQQRADRAAQTVRGDDVERIVEVGLGAPLMPK